MYVKYIVNCWSVCLYHDIHSKMDAIYFEQGLVACGGFCLYPHFPVGHVLASCHLIFLQFLFLTYTFVRIMQNYLYPPLQQPRLASVSPVVVTSAYKQL